jgi:hypothetical protein
VGVGFESIDGTGPSDIYAVGFKGEIFHFDGSSWTQIESPTTSNLNRVKCVAADGCGGSTVVYACGESGALVRGSGRWELIHTPGFTEDLWGGVEVYEGVVYVAYLGGLMRLERDKLVPVVTGLNPELDGYRLHANDGVLWSFGHDHLGYFDGNAWHAAHCPDNATP